VAAVSLVETVAVLRAVQGATLGVGATSGLPDPPLLAVLSPAEAPDRQLAVVAEFPCRQGRDRLPAVPTNFHEEEKMEFFLAIP